MSFFSWENELSRDGHRMELSGLSIVMHCHHYNINLQKTLEDTLGQEGVALMVRSVEEASRSMFRSLFIDIKSRPAVQTPFQQPHPAPFA